LAQTELNCVSLFIFASAGAFGCNLDLAHHFTALTLSFSTTDSRITAEALLIPKAALSRSVFRGIPQRQLPRPGSPEVGPSAFGVGCRRCRLCGATEVGRQVPLQGVPWGPWVPWGACEVLVMGFHSLIYKLSKHDLAWRYHVVFCLAEITNDDVVGGLK
jgi:hypothetical protein